MWGVGKIPDREALLAAKLTASCGVSHGQAALPWRVQRDAGCSDGMLRYVSRRTRDNTRPPDTVCSQMYSDGRECGRGRGGESKGAGASTDAQSNGTDQRARGIVVWGNAASYMLHHTCRGLQEWWRLTMNRFVSSFSVRIRSVLISFKIRFLSTFENPPMRTVFHATM